MGSSFLAPATISRRGLERFGMDTPSVGDLAGALVGTLGTTGVLHLDLAGVGMAGGGAIPGGDQAIMGSSHRGGPIPLAQPEALTRERAVHRPVREP